MTTHDIYDNATDIIANMELYCQARPKKNAIGVQLQKEKCREWSANMRTLMLFGQHHHIKNHVDYGSALLSNLQNLVILDILKNGSS